MGQLDAEWNLLLLHEDAEYHHLSREDLLGIVADEWAKEFNALFIGRDVDCVGRLGAFFLGDVAYACYEEFDTGRWLSSHGPPGHEDAGEYVRLSPADTEEYSLQRGLLVSKADAWQIVQSYITSLQPAGLSV